MRPKVRGWAIEGRRGFVAVDLLALTATGVLLLFIGLPAMSRARELSKRMVCSTNLAGIGATAKIYAAENNGQWMIPGFKKTLVDSASQFDYTCNGLNENDLSDRGCVGSERQFQTYSNTPANPTAGSSAGSVTRSFWLLVRSGRVTTQQFICPSSLDSVDPTLNVSLYYDFTGYQNVSYGYRVPFGPAATQPNENAVPGMVFAADKSPYYMNGVPSFTNTHGDPVRLEDVPSDWQRNNSPNHGGRNAGQGQNCLYADGHVSFQRRPTAGIANDNIYTVIANDDWADPYHKNIIHGDTVWFSPMQNPYPGQWAFGDGPNKFASTDSLIYP